MASYLGHTSVRKDAASLLNPARRQPQDPSTSSRLPAFALTPSHTASAGLDSTAEETK